MKPFCWVRKKETGLTDTFTFFAPDADEKDCEPLFTASQLEAAREEALNEVLAQLNYRWKCYDDTANEWQKAYRKQLDELTAFVTGLKKETK